MPDCCHIGASLIEYMTNRRLITLSPIRVRVKMIYFDKENHNIEETNTETFMCQGMSATNAYTELQMIQNDTVGTSG